MIPIPWEQFGDRRQHATIAAGEKGRVYYYEVPPCYVGFLYYLYCSEFFPDTYIEMKIDGQIADTLKRQVGNVENPFKFEPSPYVISSDLEFIAYNNDLSDHFWEINCDGEIYEGTVGRRQALAEKHRRV